MYRFDGMNHSIVSVQSPCFAQHLLRPWPVRRGSPKPIFQLHLCKMPADRNAGKKQAPISSTWSTEVRSIFPLTQYQKREQTHLAISYNICYMFVYSLLRIKRKRKHGTTYDLRTTDPIF